MNFISLSESRVVISTDIWMFFVSAILAVVVAVAVWISIHYFGWDPTLQPLDLAHFRHIKKKQGFFP